MNIKMLVMLLLPTVNIVSELQISEYFALHISRFLYQILDGFNAICNCHALVVLTAVRWEATVKSTIIMFETNKQNE